MRCPQCATENFNDAKVCRACGSTLAGGQFEPRVSRLAIAAFVLGILPVGGIVAIVLGIVSLVRIERSGGQRTNAENK